MRLLVVVLALALLITQVLTVVVGRLLTVDRQDADQLAANASSPAASAEPPPGDGAPTSVP